VSATVACKGGRFKEVKKSERTSYTASERVNEKVYPIPLQEKAKGGKGGCGRRSQASTADFGQEASR